MKDIVEENESSMILKRMYDWLPYKQQIFSLLRFFPLPESVIKHLHFKGILTVKVGDKCFRIQHYGYQLENEIFWGGVYGGWEKNSLKIWSALASESGYIFDVGANTGLYSLLAKTLNPSACVYAFEPVKRVYDRMVRNFELNRFTIQSEELGLSDNDGKALIYDLPTDHIYSVTINKNTNVSSFAVLPVEVDILSLKSYFQKENIPRLDLIKIDVETHEPEVLMGGRELIKKFKPAIIIEVLNHDVAERLDSFFEEMDYLLYFIDEEKGLVLNHSFIQEKSFGNFLVCTKAHFEYLIHKVKNFK